METAPTWVLGVGDILSHRRGVAGRFVLVGGESETALHPANRCLHELAGFPVRFGLLGTNDPAACNPPILSSVMATYGDPNFLAGFRLGAEV